MRVTNWNEDISLSTAAVVVAAGCGTKRILQTLVGQTPQLAEIQHRRVHMICVRAPRGALPTTSVAAMPLGLLLAAHEQPDNVTWYVTPLEFGGPSFDDVPGDAAADPDPATIVGACRSLLGLYPALPGTAGLQLGCYAGYRQDIGAMPGTRMCEVVDGAANVIVALPSGLIGPWLNVAALRDIVGALVDPSGRQPDLPGGGEDVRVGRVVEDREGFAWMSWDEWLRTYPDISGPG